MTIDELTKKISAVRVNDIHYNLYKKELNISLMPEYGINDKELKNKTFTIVFLDCKNIHIATSNKLDLSNGIEFVSWGKEKSAEDSILQLKSSSIVFRFENMFGDTIKVVCKDIDVQI